MSAKNNPEIWDVYDINKKVTGKTVERDNRHLNEGEYHLTVVGILRTRDNKIFISKRAPGKQWAPGHWEIPGGGTKAGENSFQAICREILEETNVDVSKKKDNLVYTYKRENPLEGDNYFVDIYEFELEEDDISNIKIQEEEMTDYRLASYNEIEEIAERGEFLHFDSIKHLLK